MRSMLTQEEISTYHANGFLVVADFLSPAELEEWRSAVEEALAFREAHPSWMDAVDDEYYAAVFTQRIHLGHDSPRLRALTLNPQLGRLAAELESVDRLRLWMDQALVKQPFANPTAFHIDVTYWSFQSEHAITAWIALDDATLENGALCYVPGTHTDKRFDHVAIGANVGGLFEIYPEWAEIDTVFCPVAAGGCIFHNGLTAHAAGANLTRHYRRAMTCAYMPDGVTYNGRQSALTPDQAKRYRIGDFLDDNDHFPLVYAKER